MNFGHLTHTASANTVWDVRVGVVPLHAGHVADLGRSDDPESRRPARKRLEQAPAANRPGAAQFARRSKSTVSHYRAGWFGADHEWRMGAQVDRGEHRGRMVIPTGERLCLHQRRLDTADAAGSHPFRRRVRDRRRVRERYPPAGGAGSRSMPGCDSTTPAPSVRTCPSSMPTGRHRRDHRRPGHDGHLEHRVAAPGCRHQARRRRPDDAAGSYGRFSQGILTGEISFFHPGRPSPRSSRNRRATNMMRNPAELQFDPELRAAVHGSVLDRRRSRDRPSAHGVRRRTSTRTAATSSDGRMSAVSIAKSPRCCRWPDRAGLQADQPFGAIAAIRLTNPDGLLADLQRPRHRRREDAGRTAGRRLAPTPSPGRTGCSRPAGRPPPARRSRPSAPRRPRSPHRSRSAAIRTISPTRTGACPTIVRTCSAS